MNVINVQRRVLPLCHIRTLLVDCTPGFWVLAWGFIFSAIELRTCVHGTSSTLHWWKSWIRSKFASHYAWGTNWVSECKMDVKSTWFPTWHWMDHVSWSLGLFSKTTSWRVGLTQKLRDHGTPKSHNRWFIIFRHLWRPCMNRNPLK